MSRSSPAYSRGCTTSSSLLSSRRTTWVTRPSRGSTLAATFPSPCPTPIPMDWERTSFSLFCSLSITTHSDLTLQDKMLHKK